MTAAQPQHESGLWKRWSASRGFYYSAFAIALGLLGGLGAFTFMFSGLLLLVAVVTFGVTALLVTIFEHRQEARQPFVRKVEVTEISTDPVPWGINWPHQFDSYRRLDFISSENSMGFHADQEAARILGEAIDYCRQAQAMAERIRAPEAPELEEPAGEVEGVTPTEQAPPGPYKVPGTDNANTVGE